MKHMSVHACTSYNTQWFQLTLQHLPTSKTWGNTIFQACCSAEATYTVAQTCHSGCKYHVKNGSIKHGTAGYIQKHHETPHRQRHAWCPTQQVYYRVFICFNPYTNSNHQTCDINPVIKRVQSSMSLFQLLSHLCLLRQVQRFILTINPPRGWSVILLWETGQPRPTLKISHQNDKQDMTILHISP